MSKTVSTRLQKETHEKIRDYCNEQGITINDFVKDAVERKLNSTNMPDLFNNCTSCVPESHNMMEKVVRAIHDSDSSSFEEDDNGRPLEFQAYWVYDDEKIEPKPTVTIIS